MSEVVIRSTVNRITLLLETLTGLAVSGLVLAACVTGDPDPPVRSDPDQVAVVLDETVRRDPELLAAAREVVALAERASPGRVRLMRTHTPTEQLSVTHYFAARSAPLVGVGLDQEVAVEPVLRRFPSTRLQLVAPDAEGIRRSLNDALNRALQRPVLTDASQQG